MNKPFLYCNHCTRPFHYRLKRNWIGRNLLFFLPVKKFFCACCLKSRYRIMTEKQVRKYSI